MFDVEAKEAKVKKQDSVWVFFELVSHSFGAFDVGSKASSTSDI